MLAEWPTVRVSSLADSVSETHNFGKEQLIFLNTSDVLHGNILHRRYSTVSDWPGQAKKSIRKDDILFSEIRPANGRWAFVDIEAQDYVVSTKLMVIRARTDRILPRFLYHFLTSAKITRWLQHLAESRSGTFPQITFDQVAELELTLPPLAIQARVANFLDMLDRKIRLNRRMSDTFQAMARVIFQDWFVDFGPTRAKAEGRAPSSLSAEIAANFPGALDEANRPLGWSISNLATLTSKIGSGATPRGGKDVYLNQGTALIRSQNVYDDRFVWDGLVRISEEDSQKLRNVVVQENDVLINITGDSILRTCVVDPTVLPARVNQHVAIVRAAEGIPPSFLHLYLAQATTKLYLLGNDAGGSRPAITKGHLEALPILLPSQPVLSAFKKLTEPWFARIFRNESENQTLAKVRDLLLPKLTSGEIRLKDAEKKVGDVL